MPSYTYPISARTPAHMYAHMPARTASMTGQATTVSILVVVIETTYQLAQTLILNAILTLQDALPQRLLAQPFRICFSFVLAFFNLYLYCMLLTDTAEIYSTGPVPEYTLDGYVQFSTLELLRKGHLTTCLFCLHLAYRSWRYVPCVWTCVPTCVWTCV